MRVSDSHPRDEAQTVYIYVYPQEATAMLLACRSYLDRHYEAATGVAPSFRWDELILEFVHTERVAPSFRWDDSSEAKDEKFY
jgi:hypothetical protein